ncbi:MAG: Crp/Fnr family transcriptional regulator, partial [Pseudomonadota bacterium]
MRRRRPGGGRRRFKRMGNRGRGNRCGHNPADPRLTLAQPAHKRAPKILRALERHLIEYYDRPLSTLPSLAMAPVNGRQRQRLPDSARRESCLLLLMAMIKYLDLARLCVGVPTHEGFLTLKLEFLAQQAGLGLRRAERALRDLKAANIVTVSELCEEKEDGTYVGIAAVKA